MHLPDDAPRQLAFELAPRENFSRDDFLRGPGNAAALDLIESWPNWPVPVVALIGPEGSGKRHLAAIWAAAAGGRRLASGALDEAAVPAALSTGTLAIERAGSDDLRDVDERAMFHLLNLAREQRAFVLLTARTAPAGWSIALADLASRLRALPVVTLA